MAVASGDEWPPNTSGLSLDAQASLWLGYVVRADVDAESALRHLWIDLVGGAKAEVVAPREWGALMAGVKKVLAEPPAELEPSFLDVAAAALNRAVAAHTSRNRLAHDVWYRDPFEEQFRVGKRGAGSFYDMPVRKLHEFVDAHLALLRSTWEVEALSFVVRDRIRHPSHENWRTSAPGEYQLAVEQHFAMAAGRFETDRPGEARYL